MEDNNQESYKMLVKDINPLSYKDVAEDWQRNSSEWYHALVAIEDLLIVLAIPGLKIYAWCRCKLVADDGSEAHFHWHGLVHFQDRKRESWRRQSRRVGVKFSSAKNTFKKIICLFNKEIDIIFIKVLDQFINSLEKEKKKLYVVFNSVNPDILFPKSKDGQYLKNLLLNEKLNKFNSLHNL